MRISLRGLLAGGLILAGVLGMYRQVAHGQGNASSADAGGLSAMASEIQELGPLGSERRTRHEQPDHGGEGSASDQADQRRPGDLTGASGAATS